jgi:formylglycine-generating enzyme
MIRTFLTCMAAALLLQTAALWPASSRADEVELPLGLQKEKPESGQFVKTDLGYMVPYRAAIPGTEIYYEMVPVPGDFVNFGSPQGESGQQKSETPQTEVRIDPFWMGKYEVTWKEYQQFMGLYIVFKEFEAYGIRKMDDSKEIDAITVPTELYEPTFTFEKGDDDDMPAVTMTHYAAKQYTKWLTLISGRQYRLPGEAEWEHACRAGTTTAFSFGNDASKLGEYAWYAKNSVGMNQKVGQKKPNPWGLYDMHGSAAEWVADQFDKNGYTMLQKVKKPDGLSAIHWPTVAFPRVVRGGHWGAAADECRSASRLGSDYEAWKERDPNVPLSPWWTTSDPSRGVGMRLVRSLHEHDRKVMKNFWEISDEETQFDVDVRMEEGRGARGYADPELPKERKKVE